MIYTLTINPAVDMNITADELAFGKVNRTRDAVYTPNGKGLNVSFVLKHFGLDSEILGFFGGFTGDYIVSACKNMGYRITPVRIEDTTRVNVFADVNGRECKLVNAGPVIPREKQEALLAVLRNRTDMDTLVISGSLARGIDGTYYDRILEICKSQKVKVVLDINAPRLKDLLKYEPILIKPNDEELQDIFGVSLQSEQEVKQVLRRLHTMGAKNVLLTCGAKGAYFHNGMATYYCPAYPVRMKSSACAGDACLAAFLSIWLKDSYDVETALKLACATGADVAECDGLGELKNAEAYKEKISVVKI